MNTVSKIKWLLMLALAVMLTIVAFQNLAPIEVRILFWKFSLPQAVVLSATTIAGFLMGLSAQALWKVRSWRQRGKADSEPVNS